jgi:heparanase 1
LIEEDTLTPRPNYWSALLWHRLMGKKVLEAGQSPAATVHLYAHCMPSHKGGVTLLAVNADRDAVHELKVGGKSERYALTAKDLLGSEVQLNGAELKLDATDALPRIQGQKMPGGAIALAPASITFLAFPSASNASCQ